MVSYGRGMVSLFWLFLAAFLGWSLRSVPIEIVRSEEGSDQRDTALIGSQSYVLPILRILNFVVHPWRRALIPLEIEALKREAAESLLELQKHRPAPYQHGDDFGGFLDWEILEEVVAVCENDCHAIGRFLLQKTVRGILRQNLHLTNMLRAYPGIEAQRIEKPIFLAAFARTGGTFLYQVLSDIFGEEELSCVRHFEVLAGPVEVHDPPTRAARARTELARMDAAMPILKVFHEYTDAHDPDEDAAWYLHTMRGWVVPFLFSNEKILARTFGAPDSPVWNHRFLEAVLKLKQWERGGKPRRFLLKAPEHLFGLPHLAEKFPGATFVTVFRDPVASYRSVLAFSYHYRHAYHATPTVGEAAAFADALLCAEAAALRTAHNGTYAVLQAPFERVLGETLGLVQAVADHAGLPWTPRTEERAVAAIRKRRAWKRVRTSYPMANEFLLGTSGAHPEVEEEAVKRAIAARLDRVCGARKDAPVAAAPA